MRLPAERAAPLAGRYVRVEAAEPRHHGVRPGLFQLLRELRESGRLGEDDARTAVDQVNRAYHLHEEPPAEAYENAAAKAWFRVDVDGEEVVKLRELCVDVVAMLNRHAIATRTVWTDEPGLLVYADAVQVIAVAQADDALRT